MILIGEFAAYMRKFLVFSNTLVTLRSSTSKSHRT